MNNTNSRNTLLPGNEHVTEQTVLLVKEIMRQYRLDRSMSSKMVYEAYNSIFQKHDKAQTCQSCVIRRFRHLESWAIKNNVVSKNGDITFDADLNQYPKVKLIGENGETVTARILLSVDNNNLLYQIKKYNGEILESEVIPVVDIPKYNKYKLAKNEIEITNLILLSGEIVIRNTKSKVVTHLDGTKLKPGKYELENGKKLIISPKGSRIS